MIISKLSQVVLIGVLMLFAPMAHAMGGDGSEETTTTTTTTTTPSPTEPALAPKNPPKGIAVHADYKRSKLRKIRDVQSKIAGYAKKDKLKGLATSSKRLENFVSQINTMGATYSGAKSYQFNLIFTQLKKYANQKKDKALRKWARGILDAFKVIGAREAAEEKRAKVQKAIKDKNILTETFARAEYSDARADYHKAVKSLPPEMRGLFKPMSKDPTK